MIEVAATRPYAWPFDGLGRSSLALVVVGADGGWFERCTGSTEIAAAVESLTEAIRPMGIPVAHVGHRRSGKAPRPLPTPIGSADWRFEAMGIDGTYGSPLEAVLRQAGRTQIAFAGFGLEGPVHSTLRSLNDRGLECLTLVDACAPMDRELVGAALSTIELSGGIFGAVGRSQHLISALKEAR